MLTYCPDVISLKLELCCFLTSSVAKVFTKNVKKWLRQRVTLSCAVTVIKFCVGLGKSPTEKMKLIRIPETMNPYSVSDVYKCHERFGNGRKSTEDDLRDGPPCVVKMTMKDITCDTFSKNVTQT